MFHRVRRHLNASTFIALLALVFAVTGGAFAATGAGKGNGGSNTHSLAAHAAKSKRGPRGPQGPAGAPGKEGKEGKQGPAGPAGAKGETGATGASGATGAAGAGVTTAIFKTEKGGCKEGGVELFSASGTSYVCNGEESTPGQPGIQGIQGLQGVQGIPGTNGESVTSREFKGGEEPTGEPCERRGGSEFESEPAKGKVKTYACNGKNGSGGGGSGGLPKTLGNPGEPESETGAWVMTATAEYVKDEVKAVTAVSFPIPLKTELSSEHVFIVEPGDTSNEAECPGSVAAPTAAPGDFCAYSSGALQNLVVSGKPIRVPATGDPGTGTTGALISLEAVAETVSTAGGTWAVTAE
jgi:hypothetical protein